MRMHEVQDPKDSFWGQEFKRAERVCRRASYRASRSRSGIEFFGSWLPQWKGLFIHPKLMLDACLLFGVFRRVLIVAEAKVREKPDRDACECRPFD
jgi:hypothetical protein